MANQERFGLALSGGGFRATIFHLGVVSFLRDANLLSKVKHIVSVSGGSILGAHLVQNWTRYNSASDAEFSDAAIEVINFVRRDVRGRIVRRLPYFFYPGWHRIPYLVHQYQRLLRTDRIATEGDRPELSILTANLTTGQLWSADSVGFGSEPASPDRPRTTHPKAALRVAASSAFPAFFPAIRLTARTLGLTNQQFPYPASFSDGGVFDNLGVTKFADLITSADPAAPQVVLLSDAGRAFDWTGSSTSAGFVRTVSRSMDIAMRRVADRDLEQVGCNRSAPLTPNRDLRFHLISIATEVPKGDVRHVMYEEVQRQVKFMRTDLDEFSTFEINVLLCHGYVVAGYSLLNAYNEIADLRKVPDARLPVGEILHSLRGVRQQSLPWGAAFRFGQCVALQPLGEADVDEFSPTIAVKKLQQSQRLHLRIFSFRDPISYVTLLLIVGLSTLATYAFLKAPRMNSPDYLVRDDDETIDIVAPPSFSHAPLPASMRLAVTKSIIKLKNDGKPFEIVAATRGDSISAECFSHSNAPFVEGDVTFKALMKHEYRLKVPLDYKPSMSPQRVNYELTYNNNLDAHADNLIFIPIYPTESFRVVVRWPATKKCTHVVVLKMDELGITRTVLFEGKGLSQHNSEFDWNPEAGRLIWTRQDIKPEPSGYRIDFEW